MYFLTKQEELTCIILLKCRIVAYRFRPILIPSGETRSISFNILRIFSVIISNLDAILLSDMIHNIYDVIFSVIYRLVSNLVSIPKKIKIFWSIIFIVYLATIRAHDKTIFDQSHRIVVKLPLGLTWVLNLLITKDTINFKIGSKTRERHYYTLIVNSFLALYRLRFLSTHNDHAKMNNFS